MPKALHRKYGANPDARDERDVPFHATHTTALPHVVDLRFYMPPIADQGEEGSCTAFAWAGAFDYQRAQENAHMVDPSCQFLYYHERIIEGSDVADDCGAQIRSGAKVLAKFGVLQSREWPYVPANFNRLPSVEQYEKARALRITSYQRVRADVEPLMQAVALRRPVVIGMEVFQSFESEYVQRTGLLAMPVPKERNLGGHAVVIVGYQQASRSFIVRNSWGRDWGMGGYFLMPFAYITQHVSDCWTITDAVPAPIA